MATKTSNLRPARRLFRCAACEHKLRYGASTCGACWHVTPIYNRTSFVTASVVAVVLVSAAGALSAL